MALWQHLWNLMIALWGGWCLQSILVVFQAGQFSRRITEPARVGVDDYHPKAAVIVPFKGHDTELPRHVRALISQNYPEYRLIFVFESDDDEARVHIDAELAQHQHTPPIDMIVAGQAPDDTGQKVHNQLAALAHLEKQNDDSVLWAFADSDATPGPNWLRKLAGPHCQPDRVGVTTGYRWLLPELRAQRPHPASMFASVINSSVAMCIAHGNFTQAWGGSMAVRAAFAKEHDLAGYLRGSLSDDYQMTRMARDAGRRVYFVPQCLVPSPIAMNWAELFEFGRRQYLITRVHDPKLYAKAVAVIGLYVVGFITAWAALLTTLFTGPERLFYASAAAILVVGIANQMRATYRRRAIANAFGKEHLRYLRHTLLLDRYATWLVMLINLKMLLSAAIGRTMTWRGKRYRLHTPQHIERLP